MIDRPRQRIVITGFMGAGKTTVAAALARLLDCASVDLDALVAEREGRTPQELIDEEGEAAFREAERRALVEVLARAAESKESHIIALGGGTWADARNRAAISADGSVTVWLDAPFELCWKRIQSENLSRPLGRDPARARTLYQERLSSYRLAAIRVRVDEGRDARAIAAEIAGAVEAG